MRPSINNFSIKFECTLWYYPNMPAKVKLFWSPKRWRCKMKVSQAINSYQEYHRANSKKKYAEKLWLSVHPLHRWIWWAGTWQHQPGWDPLLSDQNNRRYQTDHQAQPLLQSKSLFQLCQKFHWFRNAQSMWHSDSQKGLQDSRLQQWKIIKRYPSCIYN